MQGGGWHQWTGQRLLDTMGLVPMCTHSQRFEPDRFQPGRWGRGHGLPSLTKNLPPTDNCEQRKIQFSPMESYWVCSRHLRADPMPSSRKPTQNELNSVIVDFWSHRALFWAFLVFWLYIVVFNVIFMSFVGVSRALLMLINKIFKFCFVFFWLFVCLFAF